MDVSQLRCALVDSGFYSRIELVDTTGSTNSDVLEWQSPDKDSPQLQALFARHQTAGRGRCDRQWFSPRDQQLICSLLYTPSPTRSEDLGLLPLAVGLAIVTALGDSAHLKWPNDVLIKDRKVCGVLAQATFNPLRVAIGFGINLTLTPEELPIPQATSLLIEGIPHNPTHLAISILRECSHRLAQWSRGGRDRDLLLAAYRRRCSTLGARVRVERPAQSGVSSLVGRAVQIDSSGQLLVQTSQGLQSFSTGDVTHLRRADSFESSSRT